MSEAGKFRVAIDAMGGDFAPKEPVGGAVLAAREYGYHVLLVGDQHAVEAELSGNWMRAVWISRLSLHREL